MRGNEVIEELRRKVENGGQVSREEAVALSRVEDKKALYEAAGANPGSVCRVVFRYLLDCECPFGTLLREL